MNISSINSPSGNTSPAGYLNQADGAKTATQGHKGASLAPVDDVGAVQDKRQAALQIVNKTLTAAYEKISSRGQVASTEYQTFEPRTAEKVANNILGFIERRLQLDKSEGASQEALNARLDAGLSGFKKGFAEASEKLEALSLLSPEIKADIGKTYDLVLDGVDELRKKFIDAASLPTVEPGKPRQPQVTLASTPTAPAPATELKVPQFLPSASTSEIGYGSYEYGRARSFSFELTTREGDKVTINARASEGLAMEAGRSAKGSYASASYSSSQTFSLAVEGDLNEEELQAINDLLGRVNDLAGQFFAGNLDSAFNQALDLGYDQNQIGTFSLNLAQVDIQQVTQAYQRAAPENAVNESGNWLSEQLLPLGHFIRDLLDSVERASLFPEPVQLLEDMAERVTGPGDVEEQQGKRFRDFMDKIFSLNLE